MTACGTYSDQAKRFSSLPTAGIAAGLALPLGEPLGAAPAGSAFFVSSQPRIISTGIMSR